MRLIDIGPHEVVYDLGCGNNRVVIEAVKHGAFGICLEVDRVLRNIVEIISKIVNIENRIKIICEDVFKVDLSSINPQPTVVYLYHYSSTLEKLLTKLEKELMRGVIVLSLDTQIKGWIPIAIVIIIDSFEAIWFLWIYITDYN